MKHRPLCNLDRDKQFPRPKLLALPPEFDIDLRLREFRVCGNKVTHGAQLHAMYFVAEFWMLGERYNWILAFAIRTWLRIGRNDDAFPG